MATYNIEEIAERYKSENGRMYAGAYEWMIAEIMGFNKPSDRLRRKAASAAQKVLRNPNSSKKAKTAAGSALTQPRRKVK